MSPDRALMGYTTGVAYSQSCRPKPTSTERSRYLVVREEISTPVPSPKTPVTASSTGSSGHRAKRGAMSPQAV